MGVTVKLTWNPPPGAMLTAPPLAIQAEIVARDGAGDHAVPLMPVWLETVAGP